MESNNSIKILFKICFIGLSLLAVAVTIFLLVNSKAFFGLLEGYTSDGQINSPQWVIYTIYVVLFSAFMGLYLLRGALINTQNKPSFSKMGNHIMVLFGVSVFLLLLKNILQESDFLYREDGILENLTALLSVGASIVFIYLGSKYRSGMERLFLYGIAAFMFVFAMEEISWGQRIIGWETPELLSEVNVQNESNLHNIFNRFFELIYLAVNVTISYAIFFRQDLIKLLEKFPRFSKLATFVPSANFYYIGFIFLFLIPFTLFFDKGGETNEEIFALAIFIYAWDLFKNQKANSSTVQTT
jgi:hypothetical protein